MTGTRPAWLTDRSLVKSLGPVVGLVWVAAAVLGYTVGITATGDINEVVLMVLEGTIFAILVVWLLVAMRVWPERRIALLALTSGVVLWATGSIVVNSADSQAAASFPAPGEWLFLASYVGMAAFIVLDVGNRGNRALGVARRRDRLRRLCGALASGVLLTPFARYFPEGGLPLLVALILSRDRPDARPVRHRPGGRSARDRWSRRTVSLIAGFIAMAVADASLVLNLSLRASCFTDRRSPVGVAFILMVDAACTRAPPSCATQVGCTAATSSVVRRWRSRC